MASSSSPSDLSTKHDVFLSFRGTDTRQNFISHLAKDLRNKKIQTFIDDDKLKRGDEISPALMSAIEQSKISIIIFSENYADSKWCLEELLKILECQKKQSQIVIPVFYNVDPTHVRNQTGNFGIAFDRLLKNIAASIYPNLILRILLPFLPKEQIWRDALKEAANLSGFHALNEGSEATLIETIIADVLEKLKTGSRNVCDDRGLVGINSRMEKIMHLLDIESPEIRMVGIWGMGGIGKTTIAGQVFTKISSNFDSSCFLRDVREHVKKEGLPNIRNKLISELLKDNKLEIHTPRIGDGSIKDRLRRTKVFVVLDDVDDSFQLEELIGECGTNQFGQGSRVIVTTRNKHVLEAHDITCVYDMQILDDTDALELFGFYAFRQNQPIELYLEFSKKIVTYAKGVPLALKVLGSSLRGKIDIRDWEGELKKLKKLPNMEISNVLKTSYDGLTQEEKDIFLDIVCFFKGAYIDEVKCVLDSLYVSSHSGMTVLFDKSLITISTVVGPCTFFNNSLFTFKRLRFERNSYDEIEMQMHDLIEEMGWNIVKEESKTAGSRSRIWRPEDARDVLTKNTGTDNIKAIRLNMRGENQMVLARQAFAKMNNLQFLKITGSSETIEFPSGLNSLPEGLRYLEWDGYPLKYWPRTFNPTNLVELHLTRTRVKRLWSGKQNLRNLKVFNLNRCTNLVEIPDLSLAMNLEELNVSNCFTLDKIPSSIQHCKSLKYLNLNDHYKEIPSFMHLTNLTHLNLNFVPSSLQYLTNLTYLDFGESNLTEIPSTIQYLTNLTRLNIMSTDLTEISSSIQYLTRLTCLQLRFTSLREVPAFIQHLTNLTHLYLYHCFSLKKISSSIQHLSNLTHLSLEFCSSLTEISPIQHLTNLTHLNLCGCDGLTKNISTTLHLSTQSTNYSNLPKNIKVLCVDRIFTEVYLSSVELLTNLVELVVRNCSGYQESSNFLKELELLTPQGCKISYLWS